MKLPVLISVPHGGFQVPEEVAPLVQIGKGEIYEDTDPFARQIFNLEEDVAAYVDFAYARTFVDVNRAPNDIAPENPDGAVKSHTRVGLPIYQKELPSGVISQLLLRYHTPYHEQLTRAMNEHDIQLALDCHTMNPVGPLYAPDPGQKRPLICLSNTDGATASMETLSYLADCMARAFKVPRTTVLLNQPFKGGYIIKKGSAEGTPWVQVEINRSLYMERLDYGTDGPPVNSARIRELNWQWKRALIQFFKGSLQKNDSDREEAYS